MKLIVLASLMLAAPILNMSGVVELTTLIHIAIGFWVGIIVAALPDSTNRTVRHTRC